MHSWSSHWVSLLCFLCFPVAALLLASPLSHSPSWLCSCCVAVAVIASFATATELANFLVGKHKMPFRKAHEVVGTLVGELSRAGQDFR